MGNGIVRINDQDRAIFLKILQLKCLTLELILKWFAPEDLDLPAGKRSKLYFRLKRLIKAGFLVKRVIDGQQVYLLERPGLEAIGELNVYGLPLVSRRELETVRHDLVVAELRCYLESQGATAWGSDREFRLRGGELSYVPDGACTMRGRVVFLEVELSRKTRDRYHKIASLYTHQKGPDRVLYFYEDRKIVEYLMELVSGHPRVGFFPYSDPLPSPHHIMGCAEGAEIALSDFLDYPRGGHR